MKFLIVACALLVALASAGSLYGGKKILINEDGTIIISGANGKRITISRATQFGGQKHIQIAVGGPNMPTKKILIHDPSEYGGDFDESSSPSIWGGSNKNTFSTGSSEQQSSEEFRLKRGLSTRFAAASQVEILTDILKQYQGLINDDSYEQLLRQVNKLVKRGQISDTIYELLENLKTDDPFNVDSYVIRHIDEKVVPTSNTGKKVLLQHLQQNAAVVGKSPFAQMYHTSGLFGGLNTIPQYSGFGGLRSIYDPTMYPGTKKALLNSQIAAAYPLVTSSRNPWTSVYGTGCRSTLCRLNQLQALRSEASLTGLHPLLTQRFIDTPSSVNDVVNDLFVNDAVNDIVDVTTEPQYDVYGYKTNRDFQKYIMRQQKQQEQNQIQQTLNDVLVDKLSSPNSLYGAGLFGAHGGFGVHGMDPVVDYVGPYNYNHMRFPQMMY